MSYQIFYDSDEVLDASAGVEKCGGMGEKVVFFIIII